MNNSFKYILPALGFIISLQFSVFAQNDPPPARDIIPVFDNVRPAVKMSASIGLNVDKPKRPAYHRIAQRVDSGKVGNSDRPSKSRPQTSAANLAENKAQQIGVTLWELIPPEKQSIYESLQIKPKNDQSIYESLQLNENGKTRYLTPQRRSLDTVFQTGDYVRLSVEAAKRGYLYIADQEMYADGSLGDAYLVFPSSRIRLGANAVAPGKPVEIPDLKGNPFYFELRPSNDGGKRMTAEILTLIITDQPIAGVKISDFPAKITEAKLNEWRRKWAGRAEIFETDLNAGYTKAERESANGAKTLTNADPLPQTVFLLKKNANAGAMITVPIWYGTD